MIKHVFFNVQKQLGDGEGTMTTESSVVYLEDRPRARRFACPCSLEATVLCVKTLVVLR
jgi:hypothetical protein